MVFCILQVESPDIEFRFSLLVNQGVALRWDRRPFCVADWARDRLRDATCGRDSPQTGRDTSIGGENDFTAIVRIRDTKGGADNYAFTLES